MFFLFHGVVGWVGVVERERVGKGLGTLGDEGGLGE